MLQRPSELGSASLRFRIRGLDVSAGQARIHLFVSREVLFTSELPGFDRRLLDRMPGLWSTVCHNDDGLNFPEELRATEMGHVVEHVLLAVLIDHGVYAMGTTEWNWFEEPEGTFNITILHADLSPEIVRFALVKALEIVENLFLPVEYRRAAIGPAASSLGG